MDFSIKIFFIFLFKNVSVSSQCADKEYDYIVVGSGTTGSVVATRLSEDPNVSVLLMEAGGEPTEKSYIPLLAFDGLRSQMDWNYTSTRQSHCCNLFRGKKLPLFRGKVLGGTGTLNSMAHTRGNRKDFDSWEKLGNPGWNYTAVMHYFLKFENYQVPYPKKDAKYHSTGGPITVAIPSFKTPMAYAFLDAGTQIGQPRVDYNARTQTGFMYPPVTIKNGARCSTYTCYVKLAMQQRSNLRVLTHALATRVVVDKNKRATGVEYTRKSVKCLANARKEIIVSGGVFNSPHLLLLSGIGPKTTLNRFRIPVVADLPGVGENLQDHASVAGQMYRINKRVTYNGYRFRTKKYLDQWYANGTGPMTCPEAFEGIAYYQSKLMKNAIDFPDIEVYFASDSLMRVVKDFINPLFPPFLPGPKHDVITFAPIILRPKSRGYVTLRSNNPHDPPIINPNYLSHSDDIATLVEGVKFVRRIAGSKAFQKYGAELVVWGLIPDCILFIPFSEAYIRCVVKVMLINWNHPTSTCKMGPAKDKMSVVDHRLRVHGVSNLRVADASIMPNIVSAHPNAACTMIGEKVSDMIKEDNIGGGSTGAIIATRLSENTKDKVLLLEAGEEPPETTNIPLLAFDALETDIDWNYSSTPQKHCCSIFTGNKVHLFHGKVLGGTGTVNSLAFTRGNRKDYDFWEELGNPGWSYKDVLHYFLKLEDYQIPHLKENDKYHSKGGPMTISHPTFKTPMVDAFLEAGNEMGQPLVDYNGRTQTGFMYPPFSLKNGSRFSSYTCYLKPAMQRSNLHVVTHALVTRVVIKNKRATGVEYTRKSSNCTVNAKKEVIVSGGAYHSPHLLMLSGIGAKKTLKKFKIPVIADLPGVGENFQDHLLVGGAVYTLNKKASYNRARYYTKKYLDQWYANKTGPMTCPASFEGIAFYQSKLITNITDYPDVEIYFNSDNLMRLIRKYIHPFIPFFMPGPQTDVITFAALILRPKSRGSVTIISKNPYDPPLINPNYLSHSQDVDTLIEALKFARRIGQTNAFQKYGAKLVYGGFYPGCVIYVPVSDEYLKCIVKSLSVNFNHPTSTCKMGPVNDHMAVVDPRLRVHGIRNLRVADASIMPNIISGHPNAVCMMIGEKLIKYIFMDFIRPLILFLVLKSDFGSSKCLDHEEYDYIVVGGGSTGAIIATRLSENENDTVLLLEAGGEPSEKSNIPLLSFEAFRTEMDWNYTSTRQKHCCGLYNEHVIPLPRGRALGGSGSINSMAFIRGNRKDYDIWEELGNPGWSYKDVMHYFLKLEDYRIHHPKKDDKYHSVGGPMTISRPSFKTPIADAFLDAGIEIGQPLVDYNARTQTGFMHPPFSLKNGSRCSSYTCYLKPAMQRSNLHVGTHALVTRVIVDKEKRATGVEYTRMSSKCITNAKKEVIVSGGVFNSPQLLMLSGIGPKKTLKKFKIPVIEDLLGVGENLQDHASVGGQMYTLNKRVSLNGYRYRTKKYLDQWYANKTGPMTVPEALEGIAYYQSKLVTNENDFPDIEIYFDSDNLLRIVKQFINPLFPLFLPGPKHDVVTFAPLVLRPKSRGYVTLRSKNPHDPPIINPNYLSHPDDLKTLVEGIKLIRRLANTKAFKKYGAELIIGGFVPNCILYVLWSEEYIKCTAKFLSTSFFHPTSTCKMGPAKDKMAVVDHRLRVYGIKNLRVADASIMPNVVSAHTNAACMMIGEKVSDMIKHDNNNFPK
uniref:Glucose-methanol-choline oxidoreductase N-terminal domain-containing protein n=1 Tax=Strigamia maritima TaxID=126957 RepID=T1J046_STRMM